MFSSRLFSSPMTPVCLQLVPFLPQSALLWPSPTCLTTLPLSFLSRCLPGTLVLYTPSICSKQTQTPSPSSLNNSDSPYKNRKGPKVGFKKWQCTLRLFIFSQPICAVPLRRRDPSVRESVNLVTVHLGSVNLDLEARKAVTIPSWNRKRNHREKHKRTKIKCAIISTTILIFDST